MPKDFKKEWEDDAEYSILEGNPYYIDGPTYKSKYDISEILLDGIIPDIDTEEDAFICAIETSRFINRIGINSCEQNLYKLLSGLSYHHRVLFIEQLDTDKIKHLNIEGLLDTNDLRKIHER